MPNSNQQYKEFLRILKKSYRTTRAAAQSIAATEAKVAAILEKQGRESEFDDDSAVEVPEVFDRSQAEKDFFFLIRISSLKDIIQSVGLGDYEGLLLEKYITQHFEEQDVKRTKSLVIGSINQRHNSYMKRKAQSKED